MKPAKLEKRKQSGETQRKNPRRDTRIHASLNEEVLSGENSNGPSTSSVVTTRSMAALGPDMEVANFRERYRAFIHPSSVSSLRKNYPESIRSVGQQFYAAVSAEGRRACISLSRIFHFPSPMTQREQVHWHEITMRSSGRKAERGCNCRCQIRKEAAS